MCIVILQIYTPITFKRYVKEWEDVRPNEIESTSRNIFWTEPSPTLFHCNRFIVMETDSSTEHCVRFLAQMTLTQDLHPAEEVNMIFYIK